MAANFERAVFRYKPVVDLTKKFACYRERMSGSKLVERFGLVKRKPAILLVDSEGAILHQQQLCADPKQYLKIMRSAYALNEKRAKLKSKFLSGTCRAIR